MPAKKPTAQATKTTPKPIVTHVIAEATILEKPHIELRQLPDVRLGVGQKLNLRYTYRLQETSKQKEEYFFQMTFEIAKQFSQESPARTKPVAVRFGDRWGRSDAQTGHLEHTLIFDRPGDYTASFEVEAEYLRYHWRESIVDTQDVKKRQGLVRIHVE